MGKWLWYIPWEACRGYKWRDQKRIIRQQADIISEDIAEEVASAEEIIDEEFIEVNEDENEVMDNEEEIDNIKVIEDSQTIQSRFL